MTETKQITNFFMIARIVLVACALFVAINTSAIAASLYSARGIAVDKTANTASEAREIAIVEAQRRAFYALLRKLTPQTYHAELPQLDDNVIASMVVGVQVKNEKTSPTRYLADFTVDFKEDMILPILQAREIPYSESLSKPILVLPVFENNGVKNLWDEPNPWRDAWIEVFDSKQGPEGSITRQDDWAQVPVMPVLVPAGTLEDIKMISVDDAIYLREESINEIAKAYGAGNVLVAYASLQNQNGIRRLDISYQRNDSFSAAVVETFTGGDDDREIFRAAIFDLFSNLQESWKDQNILNRNIQNKLAVSTTIGSLADWISIKYRAQSIPAVQNLDVKELSVNSVFWEIAFLGDLSQLRSAFKQRNLLLEDEQGYWTLNNAN